MRLRARLCAAVLIAAAIAALGQVPGVTIGVPDVLPEATLWAPYSQTLTATGGNPPYTWSLASGALPPGLTLNATGLLTGAPHQAGVFNFTVGVNDSSGGSAGKALTLIVILPPTPVVSITGLTDRANPAEQPEFNVGASSTYPRDITGSVTLTFVSTAVNPADDPSIQFSTGGRVLNFTIPAGETKSTWDPLPAIQTGTVAGKIKLTLHYSAEGQNLTPTFTPVHSVSIFQAAPKIESLQVIRNAGGLQILITGYSTGREMTAASFSFTTFSGGAASQLVAVDLGTAFTTWYTSEASTPFGSAFLYSQPFTVRGDASDITSVSVTLTGALGMSEAVSADF